MYFVGIDDMFVIMQCYDNLGQQKGTNNNNKKTLKNSIYNTEERDGKKEERRFLTKVSILCCICT